MSNQLIVVFLMAGLGVVWGPIISFIAARRVAAQPVPVSAAAERRVLAAVINDESLIQVAIDNTGLEGSHFADEARGRLWDALVEAHNLNDPDHLGGAWEQLEAASDVPGLVALELASGLAAGDDPHSDGDLRDDDAGTIVVMAEDRDHLSGAASLASTGDSEVYERRVQRPTTGRLVRGALWVGSGFGLAAWLSVVNAESGMLTTLGLCLVVGVGYFVAVVDFDTMYLDFPGFFIGGAVAWAVTAFGLLSDGTGSQIWVGVAGAVLWAVVFELANLIFKLLRGVDGQGFGDTLIVFACVGIPVAVAGDLLLAVTSIVAAGLVAVVAHIPAMVRKSHGMRTALPFGPFLALGWAVAWPLMIAAGLL